MWFLLVIGYVFALDCLWLIWWIFEERLFIKLMDWLFIVGFIVYLSLYDDILAFHRKMVYIVLTLMIMHANATSSRFRPFWNHLLLLFSVLVQSIYLIDEFNNMMVTNIINVVLIMLVQDINQACINWIVGLRMLFVNEQSFLVITNIHVFNLICQWAMICIVLLEFLDLMHECYVVVTV